MNSEGTRILDKILTALITFWVTLPKLVSASEPQHSHLHKGHKNTSYRAIVRIRDDIQGVSSLDVGAQEKAGVKHGENYFRDHQFKFRIYCCAMDQT